MTSRKYLEFSSSDAVGSWKRVRRNGLIISMLLRF